MDQSEIILEIKASELQKIVEYLWKRPFGEVNELIDMIKAVDQRALAKIEAEKAKVQ